MRGDLRIIKGLGLLSLLLVLLSASTFSQDADVMINETNETNLASLNDTSIDSCNLVVLPPYYRPGGLTYGEWNARWWKWAYSMPIDKHPLFDTADCSQGQSGNVWFLGSTFATEQGPSGEVMAKVDRKCTIPYGKMLFFPVMNVEGSKLEGNGENKGELREYAKWIMDHAIDMSAEIDGMPVRDLQKYRAPSPLFTFGPLPENNVLQSLGINDTVGNSSISVADGIYLMLAPLSPGKHKIHWSGTFKFTRDPEDPESFDFVFKQDVNYTIIVKANWRPPRMFMLRDGSQ